MTVREILKILRKDGWFEVAQFKHIRSLCYCGLRVKPAMTAGDRDSKGKKMNNERFFMWAKSNGWQIELSADKKQFPTEILKRYACIPNEYKCFYEQINLCSNAGDTSWFLAEADFLETDEDAFSWNTFEKMSLEAADGDNDLLAEIKAYWDVHLPIMLCVGDDYAYYALNTSNGSIVSGYEPEFEESSLLADSFNDFLYKIINKEVKI